MKTLKLILLFSLLGLLTFGQAGQIQQIKIVSFTVKNQLPAVIDNWNNVPGSLLLVAQKPPTIRVDGVRLVLQIRANGSLVCGNNASNGLLVDNFTTRTFSASELTGILGGCHDLKDGSYSICAQFFNIDRVAISNEVCKEFTVEAPKEVDYAPPTLITPDNGKTYSSTEMLKPVMFRWTPLVPKPKEPVTYRIKVWQLMEGQNGTAAMRSNQPVVSKDVDNLTQAVVSGLYNGPCKPPYLCDFIWNVQAVNREGKPMGRNNGTSEPYTFSIKEQDETEIKPPVNTFPTNNASISSEEAKRSITFKWKPVEPKQLGLKYRLRVWQLMQGQNGTQAINKNTPVYTLDVDADGTYDPLTDGLFILKFYNGPCKPPYLCDFVWNVQALNKEGHPVGGNNGTSAPTTFSIQTQYIIQLDSLKVNCTDKPTQYSFSLIVTNQNASVAELVSVAVNSSVPAGATMGSFAPAVGTTIAPSGGTLTITGIINSSMPLTNLCIKVKIQKQGDPGKNAEDYLCDTVKACKCDACDEKKVKINIQPSNNIVINGNNTVTLNQPISITTTPPKLVKSIKAELVYFEFVPESEDCLPCNKDSKTFGNFDNGTHSQQWNYTPPKNFTNPITLPVTITLPPTVRCCDATVRWCIRWVVTFEDCTVCNKLVCYEKKKEGCAKGIPDNNNPK